MFVVTAFRGRYIGSDTPSYIDYYISTLFVDLNIMFEERMENGYKILLKILQHINNDPYTFIIFTAFFVCLSLGIYIYKYSSNQSLALLFYTTLGLFTFNLSGARQGIAMAICLFSFKYIVERRLIKFLLVVILAHYFHVSALFFIPAYFVANLKINLKNTAFVFIAFGFFVYFGEAFLLNISELSDYQQYSQLEGNSGGIIFFVIILIITVLSIIYQKQLLKLNPLNKIFINLNYVSFILWGLRILSRTAERASFYYLFTTVILIDQMITSIDDEATRKTIHFLAVSLSIVLFIYRMNGNPIYTPYYFFWASRY